MMVADLLTTLAPCLSSSSGLRDHPAPSGFDYHTIQLLPFSFAGPNCGADVELAKPWMAFPNTSLTVDPGQPLPRDGPRHALHAWADKVPARHWDQVLH